MGSNKGKGGVLKDEFWPWVTIVWDTRTINDVGIRGWKGIPFFQFFFLLIFYLIELTPLGNLGGLFEEKYLDGDVF